MPGTSDSGIFPEGEIAASMEGAANSLLLEAAFIILPFEEDCWESVFTVTDLIMKLFGSPE